MAKKAGYTVVVDIRKAGALAVLLGAAALVVALFLWMVGPAAAREVQAACNGMRPTWRNPKFPTLPTKAPDFALKDSAGQVVRLSDYKGKMVLVNFWASWCDVCKAEKKSMAAIARELGSDELVVLSVASDNDWEAVDRAMRVAFGYRGRPSQEPYGDAPFKLLLDPPGDKNLGEVANSWGIEKVPESFLVDGEGNIVMYLVNKRDWSADVVQTCLQSYLDD